MGEVKQHTKHKIINYMTNYQNKTRKKTQLERKHLAQRQERTKHTVKQILYYERTKIRKTILTELSMQDFFTQLNLDK